jgi:hypothetical protein
MLLHPEIWLVSLVDSVRKFLKRKKSVYYIGGRVPPISVQTGHIPDRTGRGLADRFVWDHSGTTGLNSMHWSAKECGLPWSALNPLPHGISSGPTGRGSFVRWLPRSSLRFSWAILDPSLWDGKSLCQGSHSFEWDIFSPPQKRRASAMHRACPVCEALHQSMVSVRVVVVVMDAVTESAAVKVRV